MGAATEGPRGGGDAEAGQGQRTRLGHDHEVHLARGCGVDLEVSPRTHRRHRSERKPAIGCAGEEIVITRRGKPVARLVPEPPDAALQVDWSQSAAVGRDRSHARMLTAEEAASLVHEAGGKW